jgi:cystathionine beta-lyase family protein involved in aluminum resistance
MAGSLIKNPGGGLAISGAYVAGRRQLVDKALNRLTAPGLGGHYGLTYNQNRPLLQGFFLAPSVVANAVKGAMLFAHVLGQLGFKVKPSADEARYDIIQAIEFGTADRLIAFCKAIQMWSPVNAHVTPEPSEMPGYPDPVIMAAGTFIEGSTIELSADGPLRPPFAAFLQGGLTYLHVKCVLEEALSLAASGELSFI